MRKNKMMRLASALLVLTLLTTCTISGTFAKYVTADDATDSARVAKWGVTVEVEGTTFASTYETHDKGYAEANSVFGSEDVVAPGTSKSMAEIAITGTPEVAVKVSYDANLTLANWEVEDKYYCPLKITVEGTTLNGMDYTSMADFETAVENLIKGYSKSYAAGETDLATVAGDNVSITWEWPFSVDDAKDTKLGDAANLATIELYVKASVTQID